MEEFAGALWHKLVTRAADTRHRDASITLSTVSKQAAILFRAMGGDAGLVVKSAQATNHGAQRSWLQRLAGSGEKADLPWRDHEALHLPESIAYFSEASLNRDLYLWLAILAAEMRPGEWFAESQQATQRVFERFPAMQLRYEKLLQATLHNRPDPAGLITDESAQESAIRQALTHPGTIHTLPAARKPWHPVVLWLHPHPPVQQLAAKSPADAADPPEQPENGHRAAEQDQKRRQAERVDMPDGKDGFIMLFRAENILSWAEYIKVNRATEEDETPDSRPADDLALMSVARDNKITASRLRFDLDLPPEESDDMPLGEGVLLPEWHYKKGILQPGHCRLQSMVAAYAVPTPLPLHLTRVARRIRSQFEALTPARVWVKKQFDGIELDLDACVQQAVDHRSGVAMNEQGLYKSMQSQDRDLACLLLADLSLSTDAYVNNQARVIDVIRDSLFLFSEALSATGDSFAMYGFSSLRRDNIRFHHIKAFEEKYNPQVRGRIAAIKPGYYTRMGAAIRHAATLLAKKPAHQRLLLLLTDGKPNDLDQYEGRYGIEDTRHALSEIRKQGIQAFCVTVDEKAGSYLPHLFGVNGYVVIRRPSELPRQLPLLYAQLTR